MNTKLQALGNKTSLFDEPSIKILEVFPFVGGRNIKIHLEFHEFQSLCPVTGQPDTGSIIIDYSPKESCIETKSLKLYLHSFRNFGSFMEKSIQEIAHDLYIKMVPHTITVQGSFLPRGGIPVSISVTRGV
jgi:7-cyano-7-deazaguanine reductase